MVEKHFSKAVEDEVKKKLLNDSYKEALKEHDLRVVGEPQLEDVKFEREQNFQYVAKVETAPDFEMPEYKVLPAKKELRTVTDQDIQRALDVLRELTRHLQRRGPHRQRRRYCGGQLYRQLRRQTAY